MYVPTLGDVEEGTGFLSLEETCFLVLVELAEVLADDPLAVIPWHVLDTGAVFLHDIVSNADLSQGNENDKINNGKS